MIESLSALLQNQLLSGGIVLMLTGSVIALCRNCPSYLWSFLLRRFTIVVDVSSDDPLFAWLSLWLAEHPYSKRARTLTATSERDDYGRVGPVSPSGASDLPQVLFTPAPGNHLLRFGRRLVWLSRERKDAAPGKEDSLMSIWKRESFVIRVLGRDQQAARMLLENARSVAITRRHQKVEVFTACYDYWQRIDERQPRPLSSVFLPAGHVDDIVRDLDRFLKGQNWYSDRGIPWQRKYLFHGLPGSGKTSLICALAGHLKMNLYILNLGSPYLSDDNLSRLFSMVPSRSFILLEDIDAAFNQRAKSDDAKNKLTFSGLLNALDGAGSKDGAVIFMTTNHLDQLDPALVRAGRADVWQEFGSATVDQANRMFCAFFPEAQSADGFGDHVAARGMSMADVQNYLIKHRDSQVRALNSLEFETESSFENVA